MARADAAGWTHDPVRETDYCPDHAEFSTPPAAGEVPPRPTASVRDPAGNPLNRDDYTKQLQARLTEGVLPAGAPVTLTAGQAEVVARLLDELSGVYRDEPLGMLARELATQLHSHLGRAELA